MVSRTKTWFKEGGYKGYWDSRRNLLTARRTPDSRLSYHESAPRVISLKYTDPKSGVTGYQEYRLALLQPTYAEVPPKEAVEIYQNTSRSQDILPVLARLDGIVALDLETNGTQAADPECYIVGVGLADASNIIYICFKTCSPEVRQTVLEWVANYEDGFVGHNIFFDAAFLQAQTGTWPNFRFCTYGLYKQLATEGFPGQSWSLKNSQLQLLNWEFKGDVELDAWLVENNYISDIKTEEKDGYVYVEDYQGRGPRWCRAMKGEMHRAPPEILGYYCGLDCAATYQLLSEVFMPSIDGQPWADAYLEYHCEVFIENVRLHVGQQLSGITIDLPALEQHHQSLLAGIEDHLANFLNHPAVRPYADIKNQEMIEKLISEEPVKFKKQKWPNEPKKFKKDGGISKVWEKWAAKTEQMEKDGPEITKHWLGWQEKVRAAKETEWLNPNSGLQMQWLFYECLGMPVLMHTESGVPSTGAKALPGFGEVGALLKKQKDDVKEEGYVKGCKESLIRGADNHHALHPQFRMPGTITCRLAGSGGVNLQQIPKSRGYLECWRPLRKGKAWVACDHTSLEQVVLAELSKDKALYKIYGPNAAPNDIYLFNGSQLPIIGEKIQAAGYNPDAPEQEAIDHVKKVCKKERTISKVITLGSSYGMGWSKLQLTLKLQGIDVTDDEAKEMVSSYWRIYAGVKEYEKFLLAEYRKNNGYVLNGVGRPVGCSEDYLKDIVNRVVQSTGHDVHMIYVQILGQLFEANNIKVDGIVWDFHDESIIECNIEDKEEVFYLMGTQAYQILNEEYLQGVIPLKGDPELVNSMAAVKCEG